MSTYRVEIVPTRAGDAERLLERGLREADVLEVWRIGGVSPEDALLDSLKDADLAATFLRDGEVVGICGVCSLQRSYLTAPVGVPWLLACDEFESPDTAIAMARISRRFIDHWHKIYGRLENIADPLHLKSLPYLHWLGFNFDWDNPLRGPMGDTLVRFWR